jgi:hypothetical protein
MQQGKGMINRPISPAPLTPTRQAINIYGGRGGARTRAQGRRLGRTGA